MDMFEQLWAEQPRQAIGFVAIALIALLSVYLFFHERSLRKQLADIQPDRRLLYLLHQWQLRNYSIIFTSVALSVAAMALWPNPAPPAKATAAAITEPAALDCNAPPPGVDPLTIEPQDPKAVLDLFEAGMADQPEPSGLDALKSRYENMLIGSYVLHNCKRTSQQEMDSILAALRDDIVRFQSNPANPTIDPQTLYASIVSAAEGSYEMVYRLSECDSAEIDMLEQQFAHFVMQYKASKAPQKADKKTSPKPTDSAPNVSITPPDAPKPPRF